MWVMRNCANCGKTMTPKDQAIIVYDATNDQTIADICCDCIKGVLTMKVVFKREAADKPFAYEQYLPVETDKT